MALILGVAFIPAASAVAQINASYQANYTSGSFYDGSIGANLLTTGQSSLGSVSAPTSALNGTFPTAGLNDGSGAGNANYTYYAVSGTSGGTVMPDAITFQLTQGYNITSIDVFSGWSDHNLGEQLFQLMLSINGGAFTSFGFFTNDASITTGSSASGSYLTTLTSGSGPIASDVTGIEFIFSNPDPSGGVGAVGASQAGGGSSGGTVIHELEAFGTTSVPEPGTCALLAVSGAGWLLARRKALR
jgi:hypothetical protein